VSESIVARRIPYSEIRQIFDAAARLEKQGKRVIHLEIGRPDFETPVHIVDAAIEALRAGKHHYCPNAGVPELREAIAAEFAREYGLVYDPGSEIVVTNGVAEGVYVTVHALLNPGDQLLIPDPAWINYGVVAVSNFVEPVGYSLFEENGFQPDPGDIESKITPRTKMILLVSPSNPTGSVLRRETVEAVARLAHTHDLLVLSDEIYSRIIYPPAVHVCPASLEGMRERTLVLNGFSKFYSMTGWRLGYVAGPRALLDPVLRYHQYAVTSANTFAQWGAIAALGGDREPSLGMVGEFRRRRDFMAKALARIPGFRLGVPEGAFYLFPSVEEAGFDGYGMSKILLEEAGVATVAGECFGSRGAGHIRISYANSHENLERAVGAISGLMEKLSKSANRPKR
jgi:aminotransferase